MQTLDALEPGGKAFMLLCNGSLTSSVGLEKGLRENLARSGCVECVISLPGGLFEDNRPPASIMLLRHPEEGLAQTLLIDLQEQGRMLALSQTGTVRELSESVIHDAVLVYRNWKSGKGYADRTGYCASVTPSAMQKHNYLLAPWEYVHGL
jgi:type I restriction enzyme M protein